MYVLKLDPQDEVIPDKSVDPEPTDRSISSDPQRLQSKKMKSSSEDTQILNLDSNEDRGENAPVPSTSTASSPGEVDSLSYANTRLQHLDAENEAVRSIWLRLKIIMIKYFSSRTFLTRLNRRVSKEQ